MNKVHASLVSFIREATSKDGNPLVKKLADKTDERIVRMMFQNYRGKDSQSRGLRLTNFGLQLMRSYFQCYEIVTPEGMKIGAQQLIYLDRKAKLPYHIGDDGNLLLFDAELGIKLKLADGDLNTLIEMDGLMSDSVTVR